MLVFDQMKKGDRSLWWLAATVLLGMLVLVGGLWYRQVYASSHYVESFKTQSIRRVRYPALRGKILDCHGNQLAINRPSYNINLYLEELSALFQEEYRQTKARLDEIKTQEASAKAVAERAGWLERIWRKKGSAKARWTPEEKTELGKKVRFLVASNLVYQLGERLGQPLILEEKRFTDHYANRLVVPMPVMEDLTPTQVAIFHEMPNKMPGLYLDVQPLREYPYRTAAAHVLGYLRRSSKVSSSGDPDFDIEDSLPGLPDYEGQVGLEGAFDDALRGHAGLKWVVVNNLGYRQSETNVIAADPGSNLVSTIDLPIQLAAEKAFAQSGTISKGAVVVMDPRSGDVLAMLSYPPFDPNSFIPRMSSEKWASLMDTNLNPLLNRATFGEYPPGSIFKIIVGLAALESGKLRADEIIRTKGYFQANPRSRPIDDLAKPGDYDFCSALAHSSNEYFIEAGIRTGLRPILEMAGRAFLGQRARLPLMQEENGFIPNDSWLANMKARGSPWRDGDLHYLSIGQGYLTVTAIQMAVMTSAVANGGKVFWPRLVSRIDPQTSNPEARGLEFPKALLRGDLHVNPRHLDIVREAMLKDVEDPLSTGSRAAVPGLKIAGKTGTAEVGLHKERKNTWFVSFAPFENPRWVVVVLAEEGGVSGGKTCAPVAQRIYKALLAMEVKG